MIQIENVELTYSHADLVDGIYHEHTYDLELTKNNVALFITQYFLLTTDMLSISLKTGVYMYG